MLSRGYTGLPDERPESRHGFDAWNACIEWSVLNTCLNRKQRCARIKHDVSVPLDGDETSGPAVLTSLSVSRH